MARTALTVIEALESYPDLPLTANAQDFVWTAGDAANGNYFVATGRELILARNVNSGSTARTVTIKSAVDALGRSGDISAYSIGAGEYAQFGVRPLTGWRQSDGHVNIDVSNAEVELAIIRLPHVS